MLILCIYDYFTYNDEESDAGSEAIRNDAYAAYEMSNLP